MSKLLFGVHMHQPVDNLGFAVDEAIEKCYAPFFEIMSKYKNFKFALHSSGWILEYIKDKYPQTFENIQKCNIEFFSGGYYEPILASIPNKSRLAQIGKLNEFILDNFAKIPRGLWLTERVWDSAIVSSLKKSGIKYTMVDDYHIYSSGKDNIEGFYTTEDNGKKVSLFPINKELRYKIPFATSDESIEEIKKYDVAIVFDDLEKFGLWPKTYEWVYEKNWLEEFVQKVLKEVETVHFHEYYHHNHSLGLIYLQNVSYLEMNEWALTKNNQSKYINYEKLLNNDSNMFLRGGLWKNFFIKYSESNRVHKRMLEFRSLRNDSLYKLQTNDVLWHGVFGGIYLPNLRDNAYKYLIECENLLKQPSIQIDDIELSGYNQIKVITKNLIYRFSTKGGSLIEFDDRENLLNYQNTLTRREEFYHKDILEPRHKQDNSGIETIHNMSFEIDDELKNNLFFDRYEKISFMDFISDDFDMSSFKKNNFNIVKDFQNTVFGTQLENGSIFLESDELIKKYFILENGFEFENDLKYQGDYKYIIEINLHFAHYHDLELNGNIVKDSGEIISNKFVFKDKFGNRDVVIEFNKDIKLHYFLLKTVSQSENGIDYIIQGISLAFEIEFIDNINLKGRFLCQK
jgi:hypothetical protein